MFYNYQKKLDGSYLAGIISGRSPGGMNSRIAPLCELAAGFGEIEPERRVCEGDLHQRGVSPGRLLCPAGRFPSWFRSLFYQVPDNVPALRCVNKYFLYPFYPILTGKERAMIDPAQEPGNRRCIHFIQLEIGTELLYGNPLLGFAGFFHILFEKIRNFPVACYDYLPDDMMCIHPSGATMNCL